MRCCVCGSCGYMHSEWHTHASPNMQNLCAQVLLMCVEGLRCAACGMRLKQALLRLPGVQGCEVDFESGRTRIMATGLVEKPVRDTVEGMGYAVRQIAFEDEPPGHGRMALWSQL